jgi:hypothetical protein
MTKLATSELLKPRIFYFEVPLYTPIEIREEDERLLDKLLAFSENIHFYNPDLRENTTYSVQPFDGAGFDAMRFFKDDGYYNEAVLTCLRTNRKCHIFFEYKKNGRFTIEKTGVIGVFRKIGQTPSIADFHINQIKDYKNVLNEEKLREFTRAIGLAANGVGIGSFVYLRRIFESLIEEAHVEAQNNDFWDDEKYKAARVVDKIKMLRHYLPEFLANHSELYGILSTGVHSLEESTCLQYFPIVKTGIELILDEKEEKRNKAAKIAKATAQIQEANKILKTKIE